MLVFFPARMVLRMATKIKRYKAAADPADLEGFAVNVRGLAKFYGITAIIALSWRWRCVPPVN